MRLYHQTTEDNLASIERNGLELSQAKGIEGPRAIYADEQGFYGKPGTISTVEFPFPLLGGTRHLSAPTQCSIKDGLRRRISWQFTFRGTNMLVTLKATWTVLAQTLRGENDRLTKDKEYGPAIDYIKQRYGK